MKKKKTNSKHHGPDKFIISQEVLDILLGFGELLVPYDTPYKTVQRAINRIKGIPSIKPWQYKSSIRYLENKNTIVTCKKNDKVFIKLTKKGKMRALSLKLSKEFSKRKKFDGKWRVVIWDIPENSNNERDKLRRLVKSLGFFQLQMSVFITPYPLPGPAIDYLKESGLIGYIRFLRVDKLDNDTDLKKHFGI